MKKAKMDEDIRIHDIDFKKSLHGYDTAEVEEYIFHLQDDFQTTCNVYEEKINDFKSKLTLSDRERHSLRDKYQESQDELQKLQESIDAKKDEAEAAENEAHSKEIEKYKQIISDLQNKLTKATKEVRTSADKETTDKIRKLEAENVAFKEAYAKLKRNSESTNADSVKYSQVVAESAKLAEALNALREKYKLLEQEVSFTRSDITCKSGTIDEIKDENERNKAMISEYEIKNAVLAQQIETIRKENNELKESNKKQAYEYAARVNAVEADLAHNKLVFQKEMQVHSYHVHQADSLIKELEKQMDQIKLSLNEAIKK